MCAFGTTGTVKEYIWLPEAEIAPTMGSRTVVDRPIAVVDGVNTGSPVTYYVHVDHLHRPVKMTNAAKSVVWSAEWTPWGAPQAITGALTLDARCSLACPPPAGPLDPRLVRPAHIPPEYRQARAPRMTGH